MKYKVNYTDQLGTNGRKWDIKTVSEKEYLKMMDDPRYIVHMAEEVKEEE